MTQEPPVYNHIQVVRAARRLYGKPVCTDTLRGFPQELSPEDFRECVLQMVIDSWYWDWPN